MRDVGFGVLVSTGPDGLPLATHLPFRLVTGAPADGPAAWTVETHLARINPHAPHLDGASVLVVVQGPHAYVSARLHAPPESVSTWNYAAVHLRGRATLTREREALRGLVERLTLDYETPEMLAAPGYDDRLLDRIVGVTVAVETVEARFKLSQKESPETKERILDHLGASPRPDDRATAALMATRPRERWTG